MVEVQSLNNWTTREFPNSMIFFLIQEFIILLLKYKIDREREKCEWKGLFSSRMPTNKSRMKFKFTKSPMETPIVIIIITSTNAKTRM